VVADPTAVFVNPAANDYRLKAGSPAINVGVAIFNGKAAPGKDILGNNRPIGGAFDIGAVEQVG
ncbi:MAG TPA: choice-of-anchor Q domain-containing protein, partial [Gemmataceae bacterium]|nr:choice-of-anchor Q domain-containing protein [Gemmataceae bacterium]